MFEEHKQEFYIHIVYKTSEEYLKLFCSELMNTSIYDENISSMLQFTVQVYNLDKSEQMNCYLNYFMSLR